MSMEAKPHSRFKQSVNPYTGKRGPRICLMDNACLICDGTCEGYERTVERMRPIREAHAAHREKMRLRNCDRHKRNRREKKASKRV